jgi:hypothetical protein
MAEASLLHELWRQGALYEVTQPSINRQLTLFLAMRLDPDRVIAVCGSSRGAICDGVLVAYIAGNFGSDRIDILQRPRKEGDSSRLIREDLQVMLGMPRLVASEKEADGVDDRALHVLNAIEQVLRVNDLHLVSNAVFEAARESLVIGPG